MFRSLTAFILLACACACTAWGQEKPTVIPAPVLGNRVSSSSEKADLAGGCYWGTQGIFEHVKGIQRVVAGFTGGHSDDDGGAESVMITFDPKVISYGQLLQIFFSVVHDPTQLNRQGPDVGSGYRSDIFYMSDQQRKIAQAYIAQLGHANVYPKPIVTRVDAYSRFNPVGLSQQDFMIKNSHLEYIEVNDLPKLTSLKQLFPASYAPLPREYH
ncbi:MAG TPA: peptide-methionine (S)-S-oxide reductase MsrA [Steroidobacteraceae bacterium]|jgi:peptide-methionine (S)-S-oxide reductase